MARPVLKRWYKIKSEVIDRTDAEQGETRKIEDKIIEAVTNYFSQGPKK